MSLDDLPTIHEVAVREMAEADRSRDSSWAPSSEPARHFGAGPLVRMLRP